MQTDEIPPVETPAPAPVGAPPATPPDPPARRPDAEELVDALSPLLVGRAAQWKIRLCAGGSDADPDDRYVVMFQPTPTDAVRYWDVTDAAGSGHPWGLVPAFLDPVRADAEDMLRATLGGLIAALTGRPADVPAGAPRVRPEFPGVAAGPPAKRRRKHRAGRRRGKTARAARKAARAAAAGAAAVPVPA